MTIDIAAYLIEVEKIYATGKATEHSYRPALQKLFDSIDPAVKSINEPTGIKVGRPDFVFIRDAGKNAQITVGHCEAKDIKIGLLPKTMDDFNKAQHDRYVKALPNLVYTNGLDFRFYKNGELTREISIGDVLMGIQPKPDQFSVLANQLIDFAAEKLQTITSAENLAEMMAGKARLIKDILFNSLKEDDHSETDLVGQYQSFKKMLIHDLTSEDFSDIYAETVAYGMFGARLHDKTLENFSRAEALELMPKSNPFLRYLFTYIAGPNLDERIRRTIDELAEIFQATDLPLLFKDFGKFTQRNDPFIHFYETFLAEYNPAKRKARGVWYTPEPVVNFIVRAVDDVLKTEFGLADGLADTSKVTVDWDTGETKNNKPVTIKKEVHRVQILDPAAGTGTFLAEVIKQIAPKIKDMAPGAWSKYVEENLIPRLHGFELLMASYAMCHMKLDMMLTEMGYKPTANPPRMGVYLTNSLEEGDREIQDLFWAKPLSEEAKQANTIKRDMPIMCVIGNPPYSGVSNNTGDGFDWIESKVADYKKEPGGLRPLEERRHWLDDDYVKFLRLATLLIDKNGSGVVAFITNHGYLSNPTFRGMRWHLLNSFDKIFVLDLHGNSNRQEVSPDGSVDKNVFDIKQGVAIIIAVKKKASAGKPQLAELVHDELYGTREHKYSELWRKKVGLSDQPLEGFHKRYFMFYPINHEKLDLYDAGFSLAEFMPNNQKGIITARDDLAIGFDKTALGDKIARFLDPKKSNEQIRKEFFGSKTEKKYPPGDTRSWKLPQARLALLTENLDQTFVSMYYRPFDRRIIALTENLVDWPRNEFMHNFSDEKLFGLSFNRGVEEDRPFTDAFVFKGRIQHHSLSNKEANNIAPLYVLPIVGSLDQSRRVNFDPKIRKAIEAAAMGAPPSPLWGGIEGGGRADLKGAAGSKNSNVGATPTPNPSPQGGGGLVGTAPDEVAIFDYIYGVLHCPAYRETYKEFLKIDFPRVPYPASPDVFWDVSAKGTQLRKLHLMEEAAIGPTPYPFEGEGDSVVGKVKFEGGRVSINEGQGFNTVPETSWNFYIGGYQPAQKWLKDRKGRALSFEDIRHYQKIIKILSETDRIMKTIEMPL